MVFVVNTVVVLAPDVKASVLDAALLVENSVHVVVAALYTLAFKSVSVPTMSDAVYPNVVLLQLDPAVRFAVVYVQYRVM